MAVSIKSITVGTNTGSSGTVSVTTSETPSATTTGDLVVVFHLNNYFTLSAMPTPTATGSPTLTSIIDADGGASNAHIRAYRYVANTAGAQTISVTETGLHDEEKAIIAIVLSGADTTTPIDGSAAATAATSTSQVAPAISPSNTDTFVITVLGSGTGSAATSYATPAPLTEDGEIHVPSVGNSGLSGVYAHNQLSASGSTGTFTFTAGSTCPYAAVTIGIRTASGGGAPSLPPILIMQTRRAY